MATANDYTISVKACSSGKIKCIEAVQEDILQFPGFEISLLRYCIQSGRFCPPTQNSFRSYVHCIS